jgi:hypothetical protein
MSSVHDEDAFLPLANQSESHDITGATMPAVARSTRAAHRGARAAHDRSDEEGSLVSGNRVQVILHGVRRKAGG